MATRAISFGYPVAGLTVTIIIQRISDGYYWDGSGWVATPPSPALSMTYDAVMRQYYSDELPTAQCTWTAFEQPADEPIYFGSYGGGFPEISPTPSSSTYTMAEPILRIRSEIRDPDGDRYTTTELLSLLDRCNAWLIHQCMIHGTDIGVSTAIYTGDGTTEWGMPSDHYGTKLFFATDKTYGGPLEKVSKAEYDRGALADEVSAVTYFAVQGNNLYFIPDLVDAEVVNLYYWGRPTKLDISDTVPYDGKFLDLMVAWGVEATLRADEFRTQGEQQMLAMFMDMAQGLMGMTRDYPRRIYVPKASWMYGKGGLSSKRFKRRSRS